MRKSWTKNNPSREARGSNQHWVDKSSPFYVSPTLGVLGGMVSRFTNFWLWLGNIETMVLAPQIAQYPITKPIFVCGLARSGSTLLHEVLASHPNIATHRIKDYPFISTPYWWRRATASTRPTELRERPHNDKMMVTSESPDSTEEMLWMAFFPQCHDPNADNRLQLQDRNTAFETYYLNHLRKLLFVEKAIRYVAKANYHIARLAYLARLFPDAKFVIPVRAPVGHISSLVRQHQWFSTGHRQSPKSLAVMQRSGHFEFGLDRRPINLGNKDRVNQIQNAWAAGNEILGWSFYWDMIYGYLSDLLESQEAIRKAAIIVRFEELCETPSEVLKHVMEHCELEDADPVIEKFAPTIKHPDYYNSPFTSDELVLIKTETSSTARRWNY